MIDPQLFGLTPDVEVKFFTPEEAAKNPGSGSGYNAVYKIGKNRTRFELLKAGKQLTQSVASVVSVEPAPVEPAPVVEAPVAPEVIEAPVTSPEPVETAAPVESAPEVAPAPVEPEVIEPAEKAPKQTAKKK